MSRSSNLILPSHLRFGFPTCLFTSNFLIIFLLPNACHISHPFHLPCCQHPKILIGWGGGHNSWSSSSSDFLYPLLICTLLSWIYSSAGSSQTPSVCVIPLMWEAVSLLNKTVGKIINLYISVTWRRDMFCFEKTATVYSDRNCSLPPFSNARNVVIRNSHFASNVRTPQK